MTVFRYVSIFLTMLVSATFSAEPSVEKLSRPAWVADYPVDLDAAPPDGVSSGLQILLVDNQFDVSSATTYGHHARKYLTHNAIQESSRISISFDPSYQRLDWHKLVIHRGGAAIDRLPDQQIRILSREENLDTDLYDGSVTAVLELENLKPGDTIEYAYSVSGSNPIFEGKASEVFSTSWSVPVHQLRVRILVPAERALFFRESKSKLIEQPARQSAGLIDRRWSADEIPAVLADSQRPVWDSPFGWLQVSEYPSWADVNQWALANYSLPSELPAELLPLVEKLRSLPSDEARILGALEHVQNDYRYLSVSTGVHSHKPYPVEEVVRRGFGDCKDKARLLCLILRSLGYIASPAFVATGFRQTIDNWLPTPDAFDHVVVQLEHEGRAYWFDPTISQQKGSLGERFFPAYGNALIITPDTTALSAVTPGGFSKSRTNSTETYRIKAYNQDVDLDVRTDYEGSAADDIRAWASSRSLEEISKGSLNYYARLYPSIRESRRPEVKDDPALNVVTITEHYVIPHIWQPISSDENKLYLDLDASLLADSLATPGTPRRSSHLALKHPARIDQTIRLQLPDESKFAPESHQVDDPAFTYRMSSSQSGRELVLQHHYESLKESVPPADLSGYLENQKKARHLLRYSINVPKSLVNGQPAQSSSASPAPDAAQNSGGTNWILVAFAIMTATVVSVACILLYFWDPAPSSHFVRSDDPRGLGGWLIIILFGLLARPINAIVGMGSLLVFLEMDFWMIFTTPGQERYHSLWGVLILFEAASLIGQAGYAVLLNVLFYQKRRSFPPLMIGMFAAIPILTIIDASLLAAVGEPDSDASKMITHTSLVAMIWIPYLLLSRRVKATFTKGRGQIRDRQDPSPPPVPALTPPPLPQPYTPLPPRRS